jgi:predicted nucleic acid-binding protein
MIKARKHKQVAFFSASYLIKMFLLDTDIIIYLIAGNEKTMRFLEGLNQTNFAISAVSHFEVLAGADKNKTTSKQLNHYLNSFQILEVNATTSFLAAKITNQTASTSKFKDLLIAANAIEHNITLITADKALAKTPKLKSKLLEIQ